ncbi:MAG: hypothetical protein ABW163_07685 [Luteimonas sp.]
MSGKHRSAPHPDPPRQEDNVATRDRMTSQGDDDTRDNNRSGEGNDASLTAGPAFTRRVRADGTVEAADEETATPASGGDTPADDDRTEGARDR